MNWYTVIVSFVQELVKQKFSTKLILALVGIYGVYVLENEIVLKLASERLIEGWMAGLIVAVGVIVVGFIVSFYIEARTEQEPLIYGGETTKETEKK